MLLLLILKIQQRVFVIWESVLNFVTSDSSSDWTLMWWMIVRVSSKSCDKRWNSYSAEEGQRHISYSKVDDLANDPSKFTERFFFEKSFMQGCFLLMVASNLGTCPSSSHKLNSCEVQTSKQLNCIITDLTSFVYIASDNSLMLFLVC